MERQMATRDGVLEARRSGNGEVAPTSVVLFFALLSAFIAVLELRVHLLASRAQPTISAASAANPGAFDAKEEATTPRL